MAGYLDGIKAGKGNRFLRNKALFAEKLIPHITRDSLTEVFDLEAKVSTANHPIRKGNPEEGPRPEIYGESS